MPPEASDLAALRATEAQVAPSPARSRSPVAWLALVVVIAVAVFAALTWERWVPAKAVTVARVAALPAAAGAEAVPATADGDEEPRFQAAGWVEADPLPVRVTSLISGVVDQVLVLEGQTVQAGQILATIDRADFELTLARVQAGLQAAQARVQAAERDVAAARADRERLDAQIRAAEARIAERADLATRLEASQRAFSEREREQARLAVQSASAERDALAAERAMRDAALARAEAAVAVAQAARDEAAVMVQRATLDLERCTVRAPIDGVIAHLHAVPGRKQMLGSDNPISTTVAEMFDPTKVQARIDVALADAAGLGIGQRVALRTEALPDQVFHGEVTRLVGEADIARNTVQVKVRIKDPNPLLRPGMLMRARFYGVEGSDAAAGSADRGAHSAAPGLRLIVPAVAAEPGTSGERWVLGADNRAIRKAVTFGASHDGGVLVRSGIGPGELLIIKPPQGLAVGDRLRVQEIVE